MPPKHRGPGLKVKTGCITCKIRRVKCDEVKPSCDRCTRTGRKCDGYILQGSSQSLIPSNNVINTISFDLPGTSEERRGFRHFRDCTAPELAGYFTEGFWDITLLQRSMHNTALKHAVVAFGSLHEKYAAGQLDVAPHESTYLFAMQQYSRAVTELRLSLQTGNLPPEVVLMSSLIFTSFDNLRGSHETALQHLTSGLNVLKDWVGNPNHSHTQKQLIEKNITPLFIRLGMQAIVHSEEKAPKTLTHVWADIVGTALRAPDDFKNLNEARLALETYLDSMTEFFYASQPLANQNQVPDTIVQKQQRHREYFRKWGVAFDAFLLKNSLSFTPKDLRAATLLKIQWLSAIIMIDSSLDGEPAFKKFTAEFQTIVNLAKALVEAESKDHKITFSPEMRIITSLYITALRCKVPNIRSEALRLLRASPRREGMWDATTESQLVQKIIDSENTEIEGKEQTPRVNSPCEFYASSQDCNTDIELLLTTGQQSRAAQPPYGGGLMPWQWNTSSSGCIPPTMTATSLASTQSSLSTPTAWSSSLTGMSPYITRASSHQDDAAILLQQDALSYGGSESEKDDAFSDSGMKIFEYFATEPPYEWD